MFYSWLYCPQEDIFCKSRVSVTVTVSVSTSFFSHWHYWLVLTDIQSCLVKRVVLFNPLQDLFRGQRGCPFVHGGQRRFLLSGPRHQLLPLRPDEPAGGNPGLSDHVGGGGGQTQCRQELGLLQVHGRLGLQGPGMQGALEEGLLYNIKDTLPD